ncbi:hypothetical protein OAQ78_07275 [Amylibacter sp.]|nr:hypothetical protein [Amylibacter sp.]
MKYNFIKKNLISLFCLTLFVSPCFANQDRKYDQCILNNIQKAQTDAAVKQIKKSCRNLFPMTKEQKLIFLKLKTDKLRSMYPKLDEYGYSTCDMIRWISEKTNRSVQDITYYYIEDTNICLE